jgi:cell wall-associated NlpC family hydrolase
VASNRWARAARTVAAGSVVMVAAAGLILVPSSASQATPNQSLDQVKQQVADLQNQAEVAQEKANAARIKVAQTQHRLDQLQRGLDGQRAKLDRLSTQMGAYAAAMYTNGGIDPSIQLVLSDNPSDFLAAAGALDQVSRTKDEAFAAARTARISLAQTQDQVNQQLATLNTLKKQADANEADVNAKLAQSKALLAKLTEQQRRQLAAQQAAQAQATTVPTSSGSSGGTSYHPPASSGRAGVAVGYAMAQVGKPYVYGAAGPDAYDCSGLTMMAWAAAGVSLPHSASMQYAMTARVSLSQLQPGDLVFFYSDIHHVGMYIGGGNFVNAENPSVGIRVQSLYDAYWQSVYVGGGRV